MPLVREADRIAQEDSPPISSKQFLKSYYHSIGATERIPAGGYVSPYVISDPVQRAQYQAILAREALESLIHPKVHEIRYEGNCEDALAHLNDFSPPSGMNYVPPPKP
jgi:hypothetical protein